MFVLMFVLANACIVTKSLKTSLCFNVLHSIQEGKSAAEGR